MKLPDIDGHRIQLVELNINGLEEMFAYSKNPLLYKFFEFEPHKTIEETRRYLQKLLKRSESETAHYWFIRLIEADKIIGSFGVHHIDWRKKSGEISYGLSPDYWGKGYFNETLKMVLYYLFIEQQFHRIFATTRCDNLPSIRGLERVGFKKEGTLRDYYLSRDGRRYDAVILALLQPEYIASDL